MPFVGEVVHYVPDGADPDASPCRAAIVMAVGESMTFHHDGLAREAAVLDLLVFDTPTSGRQGVTHDPDGAGGTWHAHGGMATYITPCPEPASVVVPLGAFDLAAGDDVHPDLSRIANSIGYALRTRGVQLTAADAIAAARRVLDQGAPHT